MQMIAQEKEQEKGKYVDVVIFLAGPNAFALETCLVREIIGEFWITPVPQSADFVEGIAPLRGEILPVVDLRKFLGLPGESVADAKIMVIRSMGAVFGLKVDKVQEIARFPESVFNDPPDIVNGIEGRYLAKIIFPGDENKPILLLNLELLAKKT